MMTSKTYCQCLITFAVAMLFTLSAYAKPVIANIYEEHSAKIYPELLEIRRDIFDHPEASGQEKRTSTLVADYLAELGLEVQRDVGGYGVVGILKGKKPGKRIVWRADMDAATFRMGDHGHSHGDLSHICGHDVNTVIGLGIANTLTNFVEELEGTVYFIFQPEEETQKGALAMISDGLLEQMQADEVYASHIGPSSTGIISTKAGNLFSHSRYLEVEFVGKHDSAQLIESVHAMMNSVTRIKSPEQFVDLLSAMDLDHGMASPETIYQDYVLFGGRPHAIEEKDQTTLSVELFTADLDDISNVVNKLEQKILQSEFKDRLVAIKTFHKRQGVDNDAGLVEQANNYLASEFGNKVIETYYGQVPFASEDFGHFQKSIPGVYFFIGASNAEKGIVAFPHMADFDVDEKVIEHGVARFASLIQHRLQAK